MSVSISVRQISSSFTTNISGGPEDGKVETQAVLLETDDRLESSKAQKVTKFPMLYILIGSFYKIVMIEIKYISQCQYIQYFRLQH